MESWPITLLCTVSICLSSSFPIALWLAPDFRSIYNEAHAPMMGTKHPSALGETGAVIFPEAWHVLGPRLEGVLRTGKATRSSVR